jgi:dienelactone hydrolase
MRFRFPLLLVPCLCCFRLLGAPAGSPAGLPPNLFDYDHAAPLDVREAGAVTRDGAVITNLSFATPGGRTNAYLVAPAARPASAAAILYVHWLGDPETTNRTEFLNEAVALTGEGIISLLVDAMWAEPKWYANRVPEDDFDRSVRQVVDLRRALDLLLAQPGVDRQRVALVGHDFGAMYGAVMGAVDRRPTTYVLMAGTPHFIDWMLFARQPKAPDEYRRRLAPLDPLNFVPQLAPAPVFFQFASRDEYVSAEKANAFFAAAQPRKQAAVYDASHDLRNADATSDRVTWLIRTLGGKR